MIFIDFLHTRHYYDSNAGVEVIQAVKHFSSLSHGPQPLR